MAFKSVVLSVEYRREFNTEGNEFYLVLYSACQ